MKKIYSKITKERRKQFQIETYIMKDGEQRLVVKRALAKDGVAHIRKMSDYYEKNKDEGILCPSNAVIATGETAIYANVLLKKGVVLPEETP